MKSWGGQWILGNQLVIVRFDWWVKCKFICSWISLKHSQVKLFGGNEKYIGIPKKT